MNEFKQAIFERGASDLIFFLISIMHRKIPCAENIFRIKAKYRDNMKYITNINQLKKIPVPMLLNESLRSELVKLYQAPATKPSASDPN
jgi:hypothetical protein